MERKITMAVEVEEAREVNKKEKKRKEKQPFLSHRDVTSTEMQHERKFSACQGGPEKLDKFRHA